MTSLVPASPALVEKKYTYDTRDKFSFVGLPLNSETNGVARLAAEIASATELPSIEMLGGTPHRALALLGLARALALAVADATFTLVLAYSAHG